MPFLDNDGVTRLTEDYLDVFARKEDAVLDPSGGLIRTDDGISVDSLTRESDGAISGSIAELTAKGHAEQVATTGKNLLPNNATNSTGNGVTFTVNADGSITANGTATATAYLVVGQTTLNAGTYTLSGSPAGGGTISTFWIDDTGQVYDGGRGTFTLDGQTTKSFRIRIASGYTCNNLTFYPQLELGSTATEYEPYTGGAPSPSPDYPQEIQVVRGRNLLDESTLKTGLVDSNGNLATTATDYVRTEKIPCDPSSSYVAQTSYDSNRQLLIYEWSSDGSYLGMSGYSKLTDGTVLKFETKATTAFVCVVFRHMSNPAVVSDFVGGCQLTLGSTPQPYVPYGHVGMEVQGRNLASDGVKQGVYALANGAYNPSNTNYVCTDKLPCNVGDSYEIRLYGCSFGATYIAWFKSDNTFISTVEPTTSNGKIYTGVAPENAASFGVSFNKASDASSISPSDVSGVYVGFGNLFTTPVPLPSRGWVAGLPDGTADALRLDGAGKCEWTLPTSMETFDGSSDESWGTMTSTPIQLILLSSSAINNVGMFTHAIRNSTTASSGQFNIASDRLYFNAGFSSVDSMRALLEAHPASLLYKLDTPVTEDCGYVDLPDIPSDVTVSIPELDALGVKYFVDDSAGILVRQWYERADDESDASIDQRIELVESNIAMIESTTAQSNHAVNSYFMLDNVLRKATAAIASGETISNSNSSPITVEQVVTALNNSVAALEKEVVFAITPSVSHRNIYRGKNLGTALTTAQKAQIAAGTFDDLYVGDYWTINGRVYRIADIDYYYNTGDTAFTKHHLVIVPDVSFGNDKMNDTNITTGAYKGSKMYTDPSSVLNTARATIANDFGSALATHRIYLQNVVTNGYASAGEWTDSTVDLMNEPMVYGSYIHAPAGNGSIVPNRITVEKSQLALFRLNHRMINQGRYWYWLRDVVSAAFFALVFADGHANYIGASYSGGVRPFFCIVGD